MRALETLVEELEQDRSLHHPSRLRQRVEALDRLEAFLLDEQLPAAAGSPSIASEIYHRARTLYGTLEVANSGVYQAIRSEIQQGARPDGLLRWIPEPDQDWDGISPAGREGYDYLDELVIGVLQFEEPAGAVPLAPEMVFYQPTPARHIFDLIGRTALGAQDVFVDLGSGLGHVSLLASICTGARCIGIELEPAYVACARHSAQGLNLSRVTFIQQDARAADFSCGTVFYLYTPFTGAVLREVLEALRQQAAGREIRICSFGPGTLTIAQQRWLEPVGRLETGRIAVFCSRQPRR